jgi:hypothetical protein
MAQVSVAEDVLTAQPSPVRELDVDVLVGLPMEGGVVISLGMFSLPDLPDYDWTEVSSDLKGRLGGCLREERGRNSHAEDVPAPRVAPRAIALTAADECAAWTSQRSCVSPDAGTAGGAGGRPSSVRSSPSSGSCTTCSMIPSNPLVWLANAVRLAGS